MSLRRTSPLERPRLVVRDGRDRLALPRCWRRTRPPMSHGARCAIPQERQDRSPPGDDARSFRCQGHGRDSSRPRRSDRPARRSRSSRSPRARPTLIETIETLKGENIDEVAIRLARRSGTEGGVHPDRQARKRRSRSSRRAPTPRPPPARTATRSVRSSSKASEEAVRRGPARGIAALEAELRKAQARGQAAQGREGRGLRRSVRPGSARRFLPGDARRSRNPSRPSRRRN